MIQTKKLMHGLIYIFWHIFIVNNINKKFLKYLEFVNILWCSKLYFSLIFYIFSYKFLLLYQPFLWKIEWEIKICAVRITHFININRTLVVIFMILEKSLFVSSVLKRDISVKNYRTIAKFKFGLMCNPMTYLCMQFQPYTYIQSKVGEWKLKISSRGITLSKNHRTKTKFEIDLHNPLM
jgi:hypothetical protein